MNTIYIPIPVEQELPTKDQKEKYFSIEVIGISDETGQEIKGTFDLTDKEFFGSRFGDLMPEVKSWLKPITSLSELPEEWKAEIREIAGKAFEAGVDHELADQFGTIPNRYPNQQEYLQKILP